MKNYLYHMTPALITGTLFLTGLSVQTMANNTTDDTNAVSISMEGDTIVANADNVNISDSVVTITEGGTYILSGTLNDGNVIVDAGSEEEVQLIFHGVSINSGTFAPVYIRQADKVIITLEEGTDNVLTNGGTYAQIDDNNVDAVIFSKDDLSFEGTGSLRISSSTEHGIVGKDDITITDGTIEIHTPDTAIRAKDNISVSGGTFELVTESDGLHAENNEDDSLGNIYITGGTFHIQVGDDGIHANTLLQIDDGTFDITAAEGLEATYVMINNGDISIAASDDGINAGKKSSQYTPTIEINDGNIVVVMGQGDTDGIDANGDIVINGGTIDVTGSSTFDYDGTGVLNGGTVIVNGQQVDTLPMQGKGGRGGMAGHGIMEGYGGEGYDGMEGRGNMENYGGMEGHVGKYGFGKKGEA